MDLGIKFFESVVMRTKVIVSQLVAQDPSDDVERPDRLKVVGQ